MKKKEDGKVLQPIARITVNGKKAKSRGTNFYLKRGTAFEIELFNPKKKRILAKIWLNGYSISSGGIVLRPGERVFLDRWLDVAKKFVFESFCVDEYTEALDESGRVTIQFYDEVRMAYSSFAPNVIYYDEAGMTSTFVTGGCTVSNFSHYSKSIDFYTSGDLGDAVTSWELPTSTNEMGKIEKGDRSEQSFESDNMMYDIVHSKTVSLHILPESMFSLSTKKKNVACSSCGVKAISLTWKFCPGCGSPLSST